LRIYQPIAEFEVDSEESLYQQVIQYPWDELMRIDNTFMIEPIVNSQIFNNSHFIGLKTKDAIADFFMNKYQKRPSVDIKNPNYRIQVHISSLNKCTISLDTSGEPLYKRGYKKRQTEASINECLAAGLVMLSGWDGDSDFYDPMCGSGTILVEAAMIATNTPPNLHRKEWAFERFKEFDKVRFEKIKAKMKEHIKPFEKNMYANDNSGKALDIAKMNFYDANVDVPFIHFSKEDFFEFHPKAASGFVLTNPPYDQRLQIQNIDLWYKNMGDVFKNFYKGFTVWIISSNKQAFRKLGLKSDQRFLLKNAGLDCEFCQYNIF